MRLEQIPIVLGVLVGLVAVAILYDALSPEGARPFRERRRRRRAELNRTGELLTAIGTLCMAAALLGRDRWRWETVVVFTGIALLLLGAWFNRQFLREVLLFRGAARRTSEEEVPPERPPQPRLRIR